MLTLSRRAALRTVAALPAVFVAARARAADGRYTLPPLPYAPDANEPSIDAMTMSIHHDKHHAAYVANLNAALADYGELAKLDLPDLLRAIPQAPESIRTALRNNGGGHANHSMFWTLMGGRGGMPSGDLAAAIDQSFGSVAAMRTQFERAGLGQFGSGWVYVTVEPDGRLAIVNRPNQDTPLMEGKKVLFGNDVWEHAYYLKYQNRRADYLAAWWNVVNWPVIEKRFDMAKAGKLAI